MAGPKAIKVQPKNTAAVILALRDEFGESKRTVLLWSRVFICKFAKTQPSVVVPDFTSTTSVSQGFRYVTSPHVTDNPTNKRKKNFTVNVVCKML